MLYKDVEIRGIEQNVYVDGEKIAPLRVTMRYESGGRADMTGVYVSDRNNMWWHVCDCPLREDAVLIADLLARHSGGQVVCKEGDSESTE